MEKQRIKKAKHALLFGESRPFGKTLSSRIFTILAIITLLANIFVPAPSLSHAQVIPLNTQASTMLAGEVPSYPFSFVVLGDTRRSDPNDAIDEEFADILLEIAALSPKPDFVIDVGDLVNTDTQGQYIVYHDHVSSWMTTNDIPFFSVPGNHEFYATDAFAHYATYVGTELDYYFDFGNSRFITVNDCQHPGDSSYHIDAAQLSSVETWLDTAPVNRFAFVHAPITRYDPIGGTGLDTPGYQAFHDLLVQYGARAAFAGHFPSTPKRGDGLSIWSVA